jgi:protein-tyrosine phosphatase
VIAKESGENDRPASENTPVSVMVDLRSRPWKSALAWLAFLGPFFFLSYRLANVAAAMRTHVPSIVFGWEHRIPFLPWTIVPYWSTDVLYGLSLFLCTTRRELSVHARRLWAAQVISVVAFMAFPLRFSFPRPETAGWFGRMFSTLYGFDLPYNQAPSLHLSLTVILWAAYARHVRGPLLWAMRAWMLLVAVSTLTTYQHHFIDLPTGIWVGLLALALFPPEERRTQSRSGELKRIAVGACYAVGFLALAAFGVWTGAAGWLLLWPAGSLALVAGIYWSGRPELFGKSDGRLPGSQLWLLAPYLAGAWLNARLRPAGSDEFAPGLFLGRALGRHENLASTVDLTAELAVPPQGVVYRNVPMLDLVVPSVEQLWAGVEAVADLRAHRPTLICCAAGCSRSASVAAACLLASGRAESVSDAIEQLRARRPRIVLGARHRLRLEEFARSLPVRHVAGGLNADPLHDSSLGRAERADFKIPKNVAIEAAGKAGR